MTFATPSLGATHESAHAFLGSFHCTSTTFCSFFLFALGTDFFSCFSLFADDGHVVIIDIADQGVEEAFVRFGFRTFGT